jgi:hypothetical protein
MGNDHKPTTGSNDKNTLIIEDRVLSHGFIQLPKLILHAKNLSRDAKLLYALLLSYAWQEGRCFPGYRRLCDDLQASENMVRKYMRELDSAGLLSQRRRGLGKTNIYTLCDLRTSTIAVQEPQETEDDKEAEEQDANLRNSNGCAGNRSELQETDNTAEKPKQPQTPQQPLQPAHAPSATRPRSGKLSSLSEILTRRKKHSTIQSQLAHAAVNPIPNQIVAYIAEIALEMGDSTKARSNLTYAMRLRTQTGCDPTRFAGILLEALAITRNRRKLQGVQPAIPELRRPMAYFWKVVRDLLGILPTQIEPKPSSALSDATDNGPAIPDRINPHEIIKTAAWSHHRSSQDYILPLPTPGTSLPNPTELTPYRTGGDG